MGFNAFDSSGFNAFISSGFNARGGAIFPTVTGSRTTSWEGTDGNGKSLWRRSPGNFVSQWAWDHGPVTAGYGVVADSSGNLYVTGTRSSAWDADANNTAGTGANASVWKLDQTGNVVWTYDTGATTRGITLDGNGNVYVGGGLSGGKNLWKLNPSGSLVWSTLVGLGLVVNSVAVDGSGNVYATNGGISGGGGGLFKRSSTGAHVWSLILGDTVFAVRYADGYVWVCGVGTSSWRLNPAGDLGDGSEASVWKVTTSGTVVSDLDLGPSIVGLVYEGGMLAATSQDLTNTWKADTSDTPGSGADKSLFYLNSSLAVQWAYRGGGAGIGTHSVAMTPDYILMAGVRNSTWHADASGASGAGVNKSWWALDRQGLVLATYDTGGNAQGTTA